MLSRASSSVNTASTQSQSSTTSSGVQQAAQTPQQQQQQQQHYNDEEEQTLPRMIMTEEDEGYDSCSLASDVPSLDRSSSDSSDGSSNQDSIAPLGGMSSPRLKPRLLRQRNSGLNNDSSQQLQMQPSDSLDSSSPAVSRSDSSTPGVPAVAVDFIPHFLLPHNMGAPIPKGPVRKHSDFEQGAYKGVDVGQCEPYYDETEPADLGVGRFRRRDEIVLHFMVELNMLWRDLLVMGMGFLFQWFHSIFTNIAYYYHTHLSAAQRVPLKDVAYEFLPLLSGNWWMVSEYLVLVIILVFSISVFSILLIRWNPPHGRPLYCIPILRRVLMSLTVCQVLRCISFLVTTLPGASRQCLYEVPHDMSREEMMFGPAHERGNPMGWAPPITVNDILFRVDATNGCGDLMFSSHTIFTMLFVCAIWRYFNWGVLKWSMLIMQIIVVPFILAARKHYSVDVFTALYVTPLIFEVIKMKFPDLDVHSSDMAAHYGIRFRRSFDEESGQPRFIMSMRGGEFYVEPADIPLDLQKAYERQNYNNGLRYPSCSAVGRRAPGGGDDLDLYYEDGELSEYDPVIV